MRPESVSDAILSNENDILVLESYEAVFEHSRSAILLRGLTTDN